jgi:hypothetical protein
LRVDIETSAPHRVCGYYFALQSTADEQCRQAFLAGVTAIRHRLNR